MARLVWEREGQDLIEYGLLTAFLSLAAAGSATMVGVSVNTWYQEIAAAINGMAVQ
jgi:Flp pilus assembly pilin Flp